MEQPWYRQYFWLLVFGAIILFTAIISFVMVCFCRSQLSKRLKLQFQRTSKTEKRQAQEQNVAVIMGNSFYQSAALPTIILPETPDHHYDTIAHGVTSPNMYRTVKKQPATLKLGINTEYNGHKHDVDLHVLNKNDRYSYASYDSIGHNTDIYYRNTATKNSTKDLEYIEVLADDDDNDYDDVEIK